MSFYELYKKINPRLKKAARRHNRYGLFIDEDDLYQEMCMHLWNKYGDGMPPGVNEAYAVKGCEFHILNYLRTHRDKASLMSMEQPINENGDTVKEILPDRGESVDETVDRDIKIQEIKGNGFSEKEKEVFGLLLEGKTIREAGQELGISHVMVMKHKKNLIRKHREGYQNSGIST